MRAEYDFSNGKRGAVIPQKGKTRISIFSVLIVRPKQPYLDWAVVANVSLVIGERLS